jgi:NADH-quinone oxidoreductase subunit B
MLMDAILKLHEEIGNAKLGVNREAIIREVEATALASKPTFQIQGLLKQ